MRKKDPRGIAELRRDLERAEQEHERLDGEASAMAARCRSAPDNEGLQERLSNLQAGVEERASTVAELRETIEQSEEQKRYLERHDGPTENVDERWQQRADIPGRSGHPDLMRTGDAARDEALRSNDAANFLPDHAREHSERTIREETEPGSPYARYVATFSDRAYLRAFAKAVNNPQLGPSEWTDEERAAVTRVRQFESERALQIGSTGAFMSAPYEVDPALILTGATNLSPLRQIARVDTITGTNEKRYVTSGHAGVKWYNESVELDAGDPTLAQPVVTCRKGASFVSFSVELDEDSAVVEELQRVFAETKAADEASDFVITDTSGGTAPVGIVTSIVANATNVIALGTNVLAASDIYTLQATLPARWRQNASAMANIAIVNGYRALPVGTGVQESLVNITTDPPRLNGWPLYEAGAMDGTLNAAAADYTVLAGDFRQFAIVDRVPMSVELIPMLMGANRRPTLERGLVMHWRAGSNVLVQDAFRLLNHSG
jgi:HK97 family phage major capsid protein